MASRLFSPIEVQASLPATPEEVYDVVADPTSYPQWLVGAQRIRRVDPSFPAPSARFEHSVGPTPEATVDDDSEALVAEPFHRLVLDVHIGPFTGIVDFELEEEDGGARLVFRERPTGPLAVLTPLLRPVLYARNAASVRRLRAYLSSPSILP